MIRILAVLLLLSSCAHTDPVVGTIIRQVEKMDNRSNTCKYTTGGNGTNLQDHTCVIYAECGLYNPGDTIRLCK